MKSFKYYVSYWVSKIKGESQTGSAVHSRKEIRKTVKAIIKKNPKYQGVNTDLAVDLMIQRISENQQEKLNHVPISEEKCQQRTFAAEMSRTDARTQKGQDVKAILAQCKAHIEKEMQTSRIRSSVQYSYVPHPQRI